MKKTLYILALVLFMSTAGLASEPETIDTFRCGSGIVQLGAQSFEVAEKCGGPISKEDVGQTGDTLRLKIEKWVYKSDGGDMRILYFKAGNLERIETYKPSN